MTSLPEISLRCLSATGKHIADLYIASVGDKGGKNPDRPSITEVRRIDADQFGETPYQLCEGQRYEYEVHPSENADLRLRCSLASRRVTLRRSYTVDTNDKPTSVSDAGLIETGTFCGSLLLEIVDGDLSIGSTALASTELTVRSVKLNYRSEFRGMLTRISSELVGLLVDSRSSTKIPYVSTFEEQDDKGWLQLQLEFLRAIIENPDFDAALYRITSFPHERLQLTREQVCPTRHRRWDATSVKALTSGMSKSSLPLSHPLRNISPIEAIASRIPSNKNILDCDTQENRFIKYIINDLRTFLTKVQNVFHKSDDRQTWGTSSQLCERLLNHVDGWLDHSFFRQVGVANSISTASPVLQRKGGYRELLRWWIQFRTTYAISWSGSDDVFKAGQRDVATLYEYWVFFELLDWFCKTCRNGVRPDIEELVDGLDEKSPSLKLKKRKELGPFTGSFNAGSRVLNAKLSYNRSFTVSTQRHQSGSWTRRLHPDYTLSFWPADFTEIEAERLELLVHIHFDAKYRVEDFFSLFGSAEDSLDDAPDDVTYKRQDLLKMHAYRDAIKRSQGAYVIYPGGNTDENIFRGFHEILPGLGAFGLSPNGDGSANGLNKLTSFLNDVLSHLATRSTAQERVSYHIARSYNEAHRISVDHTESSRTGEDSVHWNTLTKETDDRSPIGRAAPPDEHYVLLVPLTSNLISYSRNASKVPIKLARLGSDQNIPMDLLNVRHILVFDKDQNSSCNLFEVSRNSYHLASGSTFPDGLVTPEETDDIFAMMDTEIDAFYSEVTWDIGILYDSQDENNDYLKRVSLTSLLYAARQS